MKTGLACVLLVTACVAEGDDPSPPCTGGKCDGASAPRTITVGADRRPVDGALIEISLEPWPDGRWTVIRENTHFDRLAGHEVYDAETLVEGGDCVRRLHLIECGETVDDVVEIRHDGTVYDAAFVTPNGLRELDSGLVLRHVRWSRLRADGERVELIVDAGRDGFVGTLRTTSADTDGLPEVRRLFTGAACTIGDDRLSCTVDDRPVDGSLVELAAFREPYPSYDYGLTVRTAGRRLDGVEYDRTERFEGMVLK